MGVKRHKPSLFACAVVAACFALYGNTIPNGYNIDDETVTRDHPLVADGLAAIPTIFSVPHFDYGGQKWEYRPLTRATFAIEHAVVGANPHVSHFVNVLLYAAVSVVLYRFLTVLCGAGPPYVAFVATLLFVAHALHTEVVASLKSRDEILSLLFALVSASTFLKIADRPAALRTVAAGGTLVLALMSKLSAVTFVGLVPLCIAFHRPHKLRLAGVVAVALIVSVAVYVAVVASLVGSFGKESTFVEIPLWNERDPSVVLGAVANSLLFYARKLIVPYPLGFIYGYDVFEPIGILSPRALATAAAHVALAGYAAMALRRRSIGALGAAWYLIAIAPFSVVYGLVGERFAFVASVGFALMLASGFAYVWRSGTVLATRAAYASLAAVFAAHAALTLDRNRDWKDTTTLCDADLRYLERSALAHYICSRDLRRRFGPEQPSQVRTDELHKAVELARKAIAIHPGYEAAHRHAGAIYLYDLDDAQAACPFLSKASDLGPRYVEAHYDAMLCSVRTGRFDEAFELANRVLREQPDHLLGLYYSSKLHFRRGEVERAFELNDRLASLAANRDLADLNYGYFYYEMGELSRAVTHLKKALAIAPDNPQVAKDLAHIEAETTMAQTTALAN